MRSLDKGEERWESVLRLGRVLENNSRPTLDLV